MGDIDVTGSNAGQLLLPRITLREASSTDLALPRANRVYVNRNLALSHIEWLGFDMDYTLAVYRQQAMDALSIELTVENLIALKGYPQHLRDLEFDTRLPIRGLLIDKRLGHVLKMDRFAAIHKGYHGYRRLPRSELRRLYWERKLRPDSPRFHWIDTLFGLSEVAAYVAILEALEQHGDPIEYDRLFQDIRDAIDLAHANGEVHRRVLADLPAFIDRDPNLATTLHKLRSAGKKLFLLTNSPWEYTDRMMTYLLGDAMTEYRSWTMYFNVVVVSARKPAWFGEELPFRELDVRQSSAVALDGEVTKLERGHVYQGGNLMTFERLTGVRSSAVLYVGDHIYGDIVRSKKHSAWRTAMIIQELDQELAAHQSLAETIHMKLELEQERNRQEDELRFHQRRFKRLTRRSQSEPIRNEALRVKRAVDAVRARLRQLDEELERLEQQIDAAFHPYWGSLLKEGGELSSFGAQVGRYADIYMRRVSCLRHYSAQQFFRSPHDFMPHEL